VGGAEFDLLCLAARPLPDLSRIRRSLDEGIDGERLVLLAAQHGVRSNLLKCLNDLSWVSTPPVVRKKLESFRHSHLQRTLSVAHELVTVVAALTDAGIPFATFKGPMLALQLYGDLALREYSDVDLIVPEREMERAEQVLAGRGYRNAQGDRAFRQAFLRHQRQYALVREEFDAAIDLHWDFTVDPLPFPLRPAEIWSRLAFVSVGGCSVPTLAGEEVALLLAGHGTKEGWRNLGWVCDFAMLVERVADLDWARIHERARRNRTGNSILLAFMIVHLLLETPLPAALADLIERSPRIAGQAAGLVARLRSAPPDDIVHPPLEDLLLCDHASDRVWTAIKLTLAPTPGDYEALPLPPPLWPLYRLTRPLRLIAGLVGRAASRSSRPG
jgi:hypothetical protein